LHFIDKVTVAGRMQYGYRFGIVPEGGAKLAAKASTRQQGVNPPA
jgi:hypothetical protein